MVHMNSNGIATTPSTARPIPGQEYDMASVAKIDARIEHLTWVLAPGRYTGPGRADLALELDMLKFQWRGNALIRERAA
jgi:hypothetical protein